MPFRENDPDQGFTLYHADQPVVPTAENMNPFEQAASLVAPTLVDQFDKQAHAADAWQSAFQLDNTVVNAVSAMTKPTFQPDPNFDLLTTLKKENLYDDPNRDAFIGVQSKEEFDAVHQKILKDQQMRDTLAPYGIAGKLMELAAGAVDPTVLLPMAAEFKGLKAVVQGAGMGVLGAGLNSLAVHANQPEVTAQDFAQTIATSAIIGGVLGGAASFWHGRGVTPEEKLQAITENTVRDMGGPIPEEKGMALSQGDTTIPKTSPTDTTIKPDTPTELFNPVDIESTRATQATAGGADIPSVADAGGLAPAGGLEHLIAKTGPVLTNLDQTLSPKLRWMMSQLSDAGALRENRTIPSSEGGTAENRLLTWNAVPAEYARMAQTKYNEYALGPDTKVPALLQKSAAYIEGMRNPDKLTYRDFLAEVSKAAMNGDEHPIPQVAEVAKRARADIVQPTFEKAKALGLFVDGEKHVDGDMSYLGHRYNQKMLNVERTEFSRIAAEHINDKLTGQFQDAFNKFQQSKSKRDLKIEDMGRPADEVQALKEKFAAEIKALDEGIKGTPLEDLMTQIDDLRSQARAPKEVFTNKQREEFRAKAKALEETAGKPLEELKARRVELKTRMNSLNKSEAVYSARQRQKIELASKLDDRNMTTLNKLTSKVSKLQKEMDGLSDEALDSRITDLRDDFQAAGDKYDKLQERLHDLANGEETPEAGAKLFGLEGTDTKLTGKLSKLADELHSTETMDREAARGFLEHAKTVANDTAAEAVKRRAAQQANLDEAIKNLDPKKVQDRVEGLRNEGLDKEAQFHDLWKDLSAVDPLTGKADFSNYANNAAEKITQRIQGTLRKIPGLDMLMNPKGVENARLFDIPGNKLVSSVTGRSFLDLDHEGFIHDYIRTLAPDIEIASKLGDFNRDPEKNTHFQEAVTEFTQTYKDSVQAYKDANPNATQAQLDAVADKLTKQFNAYLENLNVVLSRLRNERGLPTNPDGIGYRAGRVVRDLNVTTRTGMILVRSLSDIGRPILRYKLLRTFRDGYVPFLRGLWNPNDVATREMHLAGIANNTVMAGNRYDPMNVADYMSRGTAVEKGMHWLAGTTGILSGYEPWIDTIQRITGLVSHAKMMDGLRSYFDASTAMSREDADKFLAELGMGESSRQVLWRQLQKPGAMTETQDGWWPNTGSWESDEARMVYRQALAGQVHDSVMTPGVDRMKIADKTPLHRMIFQFRTFGMSSMPKTVLYGLQKRDAGVLNSVLISLALGSLSYYANNVIVGGKALEEMNKSFEDGSFPEVFADEAINRSGTVGLFADLQDILSKIPIVADATSISGVHHMITGSGQIARTGGSTPSGDRLAAAIGGPTVDLALNEFKNITRFHPRADGSLPWQSTIHDLRRDFLPLENWALIRRGLDKMDGTAP